jgi:hypothetical protein
MEERRRRERLRLRRDWRLEDPKKGEGEGQACPFQGLATLKDQGFLLAAGKGESYKVWLTWAKEPK